MNETPVSRSPKPSLRAASGVLAALFCWLLSPAPSGASRPEPLGARVSARAFSSMAPGLKKHLDEAFAMASLRVESVESCRGLFADLDHPAGRSLAETLYVPAPGVQERRICRRGVAAFTEVGSRVTYLCRDFARLPTRRAAIILVHEALHLAGLEEAPRQRDALSSVEINGLVAGRCEL